MPSGVPLDSPWTDESLAVEALRLRDVEGLSNAKIAVRLGKGLTRNAIIGKLLRLDVAAGRIKTKRPVKTEQERRLSAKLSKERHRQTSKLHRPRNLAPKPPRQVAFDPPTAPTSATNVTMVDLPYSGACKFPVGEATGAAQLFCGGAAKGVWCPYHRLIVWQPNEERRTKRQPVSNYRKFGEAA